ARPGPAAAGRGAVNGDAAVGAAVVAAGAAAWAACLVPEARDRVDDVRVDINVIGAVGPGKDDGDDAGNLDPAGAEAVEVGARGTEDVPGTAPGAAEPGAAPGRAADAAGARAGRRGIPGLATRATP